MNFHWLLLSLATAGATTPHNSCMSSDPELVYCPAPEAPRIAELRGGTVTLELQIDPDGSVRSSTVLSSSGHSAWPSAAQSAVAKWRYSADSASRTRKVPFDFQFGSP
ncbi:energy transducer TonB [Stenotrophomonas capsici]|uniref:energy transducer TonB n=1 Tax=Stenotrophomonas capsici TaxID=3110230 RepID=UPI003CE59DB7